MSNKKTTLISPPQNQLALDLPVTSSFAREDIVEGQANALAIHLIDRWPDWPGKVVILAGPTGSGKTHIASVWSKMAKAYMAEMEELDSLGDDLISASNLVLENAAPGNISERSLFHLLNAKRAAGASLLITSRSWPSEWKVKLADLNSRLRAAQLVELDEPDDELLRMVLYKHFSDRQITVEPSVVDYLVLRMERSLEAANKIVSRLDNRGLELKRKITRQMAGEILAQEWEEE